MDLLDSISKRCDLYAWFFSAPTRITNTSPHSSVPGTLFFLISLMDIDFLLFVANGVENVVTWTLFLRWCTTLKPVQVHPLRRVPSPFRVVRRDANVAEFLKQYKIVPSRWCFDLLNNSSTIPFSILSQNEPPDLHVKRNSTWIGVFNLLRSMYRLELGMNISSSLPNGECLESSGLGLWFIKIQKHFYNSFVIYDARASNLSINFEVCWTNRHHHYCHHQYSPDSKLMRQCVGSGWIIKVDTLMSPFLITQTTEKFITVTENYRINFFHPRHQLYLMRHRIRSNNLFSIEIISLLYSLHKFAQIYI